MGSSVVGEMDSRLKELEQSGSLNGREIYLFGHCNVTEMMADRLLDMGLRVRAILDNNSAKYGNAYRGIPIVSPDTMVDRDAEHTVVLIAVRFYAAMRRQLERLGYSGEVLKVVEYDSYAEYSLSEDTIRRKLERVERGRARWENRDGKREGAEDGDASVQFIFCPYTSLGDVFYASSYLPYHLKRVHASRAVIFVLSRACAQVAALFTEDPVEILSQQEMDEMIQAALYDRRADFFVAHNDKPYFCHLSKALHVKKIPFEELYRCGVYGLSPETEPIKPEYIRKYSGNEEIRPGQTVILSPYANSVVDAPAEVWEKYLSAYREKGFLMYTNVAAEQDPLPGTEPISPALNEMQDLVERAGHFVGLRSGLCDVLKYADCDKTALYPDYCFSGTQWKSIDVFALEGWKNVTI